jgi:hypothetical protein
MLGGETFVVYAGLAGYPAAMRLRARIHVNNTTEYLVAFLGMVGRGA